ncbi:MAG: hypothetical protein HYT12_01490 [Candidatus Liptonbacteria bacterium]|nr:hypothetical protein [Candidatus Liptonbacteria bacterium]
MDNIFHLPFFPAVCTCQFLREFYNINKDLSKAFWLDILVVGFGARVAKPRKKLLRNLTGQAGKAYLVQSAGVAKWQTHQL